MRISSAANVLACSFFIFIIAYLWASYYLRGFFLPLLAAAGVTAAANYLIAFLWKKRNQTNTTAKKHREQMHRVMLQLKFMTKAQTLRLFKAALCGKYNCLLTAKKLVIQIETGETDADKSGNEDEDGSDTKNSGKNKAGKENKDRKIEIFSLFHKGTPTETDIIECLKAGTQNSRTVIAAEAFTPAVVLFVRSLKIDVILLDASQIYNQILMPNQIYPKEFVEIKKTAKLSMRDLKELFFSRTRTKSYVITAIIILLSSLVIKFSLYYIIIATIVFGLALSSHFAPAGQNKKLFD